MNTIRTMEVNWVDREGRETKKEVPRSGWKEKTRYFRLERFQMITNLGK